MPSAWCERYCSTCSGFHGQILRYPSLAKLHTDGGISINQPFGDGKRHQAAINRFLAETNAEPKPFTWTADPDKIIAAVRRGHQAFNSIH